MSAKNTTEEAVVEITLGGQAKNACHKAAEAACKQEEINATLVERKEATYKAFVDAWKTVHEDKTGKRPSKVPVDLSDIQRESALTATAYIKAEMLRLRPDMNEHHASEVLSQARKFGKFPPLRKRTPQTGGDGATATATATDKPVDNMPDVRPDSPKWQDQLTSKLAAIADEHGVEAVEAWFLEFSKKLAKWAKAEKK
jgi:hypothetical protein